MANLIAPLRKAHRVDQFLYLICPNRTPDKKLCDLEVSKFLNRFTPVRPVLPTGQISINRSNLI
jgi:hypothetical protein